MLLGLKKPVTVLVTVRNIGKESTEKEESLKPIGALGFFDGAASQI